MGKRNLRNRIDYKHKADADKGDGKWLPQGNLFQAINNHHSRVGTSNVAI